LVETFRHGKIFYNGISSPLNIPPWSETSKNVKKVRNVRVDFRVFRIFTTKEFVELKPKRKECAIVFQKPLKFKS
jgi:hypothetical protein